MECGGGMGHGQGHGGGHAGPGTRGGRGGHGGGCSCGCGGGCSCGCGGGGGCCCGGRGHGFHRRYQTHEEQAAELETYLAELKTEVQAVEERLAALRR